MRMTKTSAFLMAVALSVLPMAAMAQTTSNASGGEATASANTGGDHQKWKDMTPEQREQARAARKAKWDAMTPQQKEAAKAERKAKFDALPPEKQAEIKARREHRKEMHQQHKDASGSPTTTTAPAAQ